MTGLSMRGRHGNQRRGPRVEYVALQCQQCQGTFKLSPGVYRQRQYAKYCSKACEATAKRKPERFALISCAHCGASRQKRSDHMALATNHYCSKACVIASRTGKPQSQLTPGFWWEGGYKVIQVDGEPIKQHRWVMQQHLGRTLGPREVVHHINGDRADNRIENLQLMSWGEHSREHRLEEIAAGKELFGRAGRGRG